MTKAEKMEIEAINCYESFDAGRYGCIMCELHDICYKRTGKTERDSYQDLVDTANSAYISGLEPRFRD